MTNELSKLHARVCLTAEGFVVEDIPASQEKRADLRAWWGSEEYVVEAKEKEESAFWQDVVAEAMAGPGVVSRAAPVAPWSAISRMVDRAHRQLAATPAGPGALRILWVVAPHLDDLFVVECVRMRLFGEESLGAVKTMLEVGTAAQRTMPCYFYGHSDFRNYPNLDAAVLSVRRGACLCVNTFSPRKESLRASRLHARAQTHGSVIDPEVAEQRKAALLIDRDFVGRPGDRKPLWGYLRQRYGLLTQPMPETRLLSLASAEHGEEMGRP